jgi:hypothetical protein
MKRPFASRLKRHLTISCNSGRSLSCNTRGALCRNITSSETILSSRPIPRKPANSWQPASAPCSLSVSASLALCISPSTRTEPAPQRAVQVLIHRRHWAVFCLGRAVGKPAPATLTRLAVKSAENSQKQWTTLKTAHRLPFCVVFKVSVGATKRSPPFSRAACQNAAKKRGASRCRAKILNIS